MEEKTATIQTRTTEQLKQKLEAYARGKGMTKLTRLVWIALANEVGKDNPELKDEILAQM